MITYDVHENCLIFKTSHPIVHLRPKFCHPLELGRPISNEPPSPNDNQSVKKNTIQGWLLYAIRSFSSGRLSFSVFNSLNLSGFPLTSFHLAEASQSAFSWLYNLVCAVAPKYLEMSFIYNYSHFSTHFAINLFHLHNLKT